ncbi:MAG TPA: zinc-binding dehydrogenase [Streptosporangiaceae bacterium]
MRAAGITEFSGPVQPLTLPELDEPGPDEVLIDVRYSGVAGWDDVVRTGDWDVGRQPPMALGVAMAGVVARPGGADSQLRPGQPVMAHSLPLRRQGTWAEQFICAAADVAPLPDGLPFKVAGAAPVPLLTAEQALRMGQGALPAASQVPGEPGQQSAPGAKPGGAGRATAAEDRPADPAAGLDGMTVLVSGAGGVTGLVLVQLAAYLGGRVLATAGQRSAGRVRAAGAAEVIDYRADNWPGQVRALTGGTGTDLAVNAAPGSAAAALRAVRDGGALVTITSDLPPAERGITVSQLYVAPDGPRLTWLGTLLAAGVLRVTPAADYGLGQAAEALGHAISGTGGQSVLLRTA